MRAVAETVDRAPLIVNFSQAEMDLLAEWAELRNSTHGGKHSGHRAFKYAKHPSTKTNLLGVKAEYAVWREIGGVWLRHYSNGHDPGVDILVISQSGARISVSVKGNNSADNPYFYVRPWETFICDIGVLGVPHGSTGLRLMGVCGRYYFEHAAGPSPKTWPQPVEKALHYTKLMPVAPMFDWLRQFRGTGPVINATDWEL